MHLDFRTWSVSKVSSFEMLESSFLAWKKDFNWTRRRNFSTSCLTESLSGFLDMGTKFKPLLRTDFSESESSKFSVMVTTVLMFSGHESLVIWEIGLFSADHSSEERSENLVLRLNLSLLISSRLFLMKKSKYANWPSGGYHLDFRTWSVSKVSSFEMLESSSLPTREQNLSPYWEMIFRNRKVVNFLVW